MKMGLIMDFRLFYTDGGKQEAISFNSCLNLAKSYVSDDAASLKLAGYFLEQQALLKAAEQKASSERQKASSEEQRRKALEDFRAKEEKLWKEKEQYLNMEALRSKGCFHREAYSSDSCSSLTLRTCKAESPNVDLLRPTCARTWILCKVVFILFILRTIFCFI
jgi:hypothetical protein